VLCSGTVPHLARLRERLLFSFRRTTCREKMLVWLRLLGRFSQKLILLENKYGEYWVKVTFALVSLRIQFKNKEKFKSNVCMQYEI